MEFCRLGVAGPMMAGMRVVEVAVYRGPHLYSRTKMVRLQVDLGELEQYPTSLLLGFPEKLLHMLPGLERHGCSYGERGGFLRRMEEGTWLGHVVEHVAIELQNMVGADVARGKTRSVPRQTGVYNVMFEYKDEAVGLAAGRLALEVVDSLLPTYLRGLEWLDKITTSPLDAFDFSTALHHLRELQIKHAFGPTTVSIVNEAEKRGIPWRRMDASSLVQFGSGKYVKRIRASCSSLTSEIATEIAGDKELTNHLLLEAGLPSPRGVLVTDQEAAIEAARKLGFPVVTKPIDGNHGRGVNIGLSRPEDVRWGFSQAQAHSGQVLVEQQFEGVDHRLLVIGGKLVAAAKRVPACVTGDGMSTIEQLIMQENRDPRRGEGHEVALTKIAIDDCLLHFLKSAGRTLLTIPAMGEQVLLRPTANLSTGGKAVDCTDIVHPDNALVACRAAQIVGLDIAGIDFVTPDITRSVFEVGGGVIEVNAGPGFRMHLCPSEGVPRNVAAPVMDLLYPSNAPSRIPVFAVTGTNGKTTTARMLAHILSASGLKVGMTSSSGVFIDGKRVMDGDCTGPKSARLVLGEPGIDAAVLETARGGLLREGLAFDTCDIGCVTNVTSDHLGLKGIETLEDLACVKAVVVEAVHRKGWSVLNADNDYAAAMRREAGGQTCFFTTRRQGKWPDFLKEHVTAGGRALCCDLEAERSEILIYDGGGTLFVSNVEDIPATLNGMAGFNVENALAAAAMAYCNNIPLPVIRAALGTFGTSYEQSAGRLNIVERGGSRIIVDYAHNASGLRALGTLVNKMRPGFLTTIGVIGIAGDRRDQDIIEMGEVAAGIFDKLILKEDDELRGRSPGEAAALLRQGAMRAGLSPTDVEIVLSETEAVARAVDHARNNVLVVVTADDIGSVWRQVSATPAVSIPPLSQLPPSSIEMRTV
ncbi:cyanophycin synthetase [Neorhizobium sp. 2083]|uniref:cyanophycin synthetase n=1 Tax=Neorhizobium sp. 2083 TaxID=2817762 RepID=UPI0028622DFC|nr:cyanophycin synthetase [Neorhizobium sp. 2083]MDR6821069.1 cyanophycin synthetase [Neorhizobium sp. 2083]